MYCLTFFFYAARNKQKDISTERFGIYFIILEKIGYKKVRKK